jgi:hypothetical protein
MLMYIHTRVYSYVLLHAGNIHVCLFGLNSNHEHDNEPHEKQHLAEHISMLAHVRCRCWYQPTSSEPLTSVEYVNSSRGTLGFRGESLNPHLDLSHQVIPLTLHFFQLQIRHVKRSRLLGSKQHVCGVPHSVCWSKMDKHTKDVENLWEKPLREWCRNGGCSTSMLHYRRVHSIMRLFPMLKYTRWDRQAELQDVTSENQELLLMNTWKNGQRATSWTSGWIEFFTSLKERKFHQWKHGCEMCVVIHPKYVIPMLVNPAICWFHAATAKSWALVFAQILT